MPLSDDLAALHASAFDGPARWSASALRAAREDSACFFVMAKGAAPPTGFALGRVILDEAELLTLVVAGDHRRRGLGRDLLVQFENTARGRGAGAAFLEVSASNRAAQALYAWSGWRDVGRRSGYYDGVDAITMRKDL